MAETRESFFEKYIYFVTKNPLLASEIEVALKWASYLVAGRFSQSPVVTELIHFASKLLNLINDSILRKAAGIPVNVDVTVERLQTFLTVIEYSEVFTEIAARQISGVRAKWLIVILLQLSKFLIRILLLLRHEQGLQRFPPVPPLNRQKELPGLCKDKDAEDALLDDGTHPNVEVTFSLKTSGRVMRTLDAAPPLVSRSWKLPKTEANCRFLSQHPTKLSGKYFTAEMLHICRPLIHLASLGAFGEFSWKPWMIALGMDATSYHLLKQNSDFNKIEKQEINRRAFTMILYLLRSPFYDNYSKMRIINLLKGISDHVVGSGLLLRPLIEYIPEWQQLYFYAWSS